MDIDGSLISDLEAYQLTKLKTLTHLSIKSKHVSTIDCYFLTNAFIDHLTLNLNETSLSHINLQQGSFDEDKVSYLLKLLANK